VLDGGEPNSSATYDYDRADRTWRDDFQDQLLSCLIREPRGSAYQHRRGRVDPETWQIAFHDQIPYDHSAAAAAEPSKGGSRRHDIGLPRKLRDTLV
jgi:hypothetical protein